MIKDLNACCEKLIKEQKQEEGVFSKLLSYEEASKVLNGDVPPYIKEGSDFRVVKLTNDDLGCPCGGTHVKHLSDIQTITVTKI